MIIHPKAPCMTLRPPQRAGDFRATWASTWLTLIRATGGPPVVPPLRCKLTTWLLEKSSLAMVGVACVSEFGHVVVNIYSLVDVNLENAEINHLWFRETMGKMASIARLIDRGTYKTLVKNSGFKPELSIHQGFWWAMKFHQISWLPASSLPVLGRVETIRLVVTTRQVLNTRTTQLCR